MNPLKKKFAIRIGILALTVTLGGNAHALMGFECFFALDTETIGKLSTKHVIRVKDGVFHRSATIDFGDGTLGTERPGDIVMAHGEEHIVLEINKQPGWTQYVFIGRSDLSHFNDLLSGNTKQNP
ncbi:MAG: hypothetical protein HY268_19775 [Deltaproteobacteria bacterium]|nr:hypothetical protein [Deltaproteobacteria bacterium]